MKKYKITREYNDSTLEYPTQFTIDNIDDAASFLLKAQDKLNLIRDDFCKAKAKRYAEEINILMNKLVNFSDETFDFVRKYETKEDEEDEEEE